MMILPFIIKNWQILVFGVLIATLTASGFFISHLLSKNATLKTEKAALEQTIRDERENHRLIVKSLEDKAQDVAKRREFRDDNTRQIDKDKVSGDAMVAPVFLNTVKRLRARQDTTP